MEGKADPNLSALVPEGIVHDYFDLRLNYGVAMNSSVVLLHRERLLELGGYSEFHRHAEDIELGFRLACSEKLYYLPEPLCTIDVGTPGSLTKTVSLPERIDALASLLKTYESYKREGRIPAEMRASTARFMRNQQATFVAANVRSASGLSSTIRPAISMVTIPSSAFDRIAAF